MFGLDFGNNSLKVMQLEYEDGSPNIVGYGAVTFDRKALHNGVITDIKTLSSAVHELFEKHLVGEITTSRLAMAIPSYRTFARTIQLPSLADDEVHDAVQLQVEQYVPRPLDELYLDYMTVNQTSESRDLFVVATPRSIVDTHLTLTQLLGLETVSIEPAGIASARLFSLDKRSSSPSIIIDFGSLTADISIYDKSILATSTVSAGGLVFTEAIKRKLKVSMEEAGFIKTRYGLDPSVAQKDINEALQPALQKIVTEVRRMIRYYEERYKPSSSVEQIVAFGGGANMPGLANYLTNELKVPVRTQSNPWAVFGAAKLKPPKVADRMMYITSAGLSLLSPEEVYAA